jgi:hypothetical protein
MVTAERRAKKAVYQREWRLRNPDKAASFVKASKAKKPDSYKAAERAYYQLNREKILERVAAKYIPHPRVRSCKSKLERAAQNKAWHEANRERRLHQKREWNARNTHKLSAYSAQRRAALLQATPTWANRFFIEQAFDIAIVRTQVTGIRWEVDHIIPLISDSVCGLHVEHNLQVIPMVVNRSKGNQHWPGQP